MEMLGIPPERVMGTNAGTKLDEREGKTASVFDGTIDHLNDREGKPVTINLAVGARPIFVAGNEGGRGDIAMMRWSKDRQGPSFQLLVNHDDPVREFEYAEPDNYSLNAAKEHGFHAPSASRMTGRPSLLRKVQARYDLEADVIGQLSIRFYISSRTWARRRCDRAAAASAGEQAGKRS